MVDNTGSDGGDYQYDQYNRLTYVQAGTYFRYYQYDPFGNIRDFSALTLDYATNATGAPATNRISSDGVGGNYSYDEAGNMTAGMGQSYAYDGANRLKTAGYGSSAYGYDGDGIRVKKAENGATTYYVQSSALKNTAMEVNSTGVLRAYVYGGSSKLVAMQATNGQFYWLHTNHLNSSRAMTDTNGNLTYKGQFDPYGQALSEWSSAGNINLNTKKFTGYERDGATGLDYAKARMYSSGRGRFVTPDPINIRAANKQRPQTLNRYSYVSNDPINYIDASGTCLVFWSQVNETYGFWDTSLCYPGGDALPMPEMPGEPPPVPVGVETEQSKNGKDRLLNKLNHLPKECIDAFGGQIK